MGYLVVKFEDGELGMRVVKRIDEDKWVLGTIKGFQKREFIVAWDYDPEVTRLVDPKNVQPPKPAKQCSDPLP